MMLIKNFVKVSDIHGIGLFAGQNIKQGDKIWEFIEGMDVILPAEVLDSPVESIRAYMRRYTYPHPHIPGDIILDGDNGRFMNHSNTPNTDFKTPNVGYALVDISEGTELTCDYGEFSEGLTPED